MRLKIPGLLLLLYVISVPGAALAYIGPGAGLSAIGTLLALVAAVLLAIVGFIWYPIKRLLKKRKSSASSRKENATTDGT